ncbi:protocadherin alpha-5-like [Erythrolamprus reginae]|uniref:protocadherin alpha-5-like n=1 Tax=Erythrolamprus reginae TaxID=121349 RepID=UPI00396C77D2
MLTWPKGLLQLFLLHTAWKMGSGQLHYSVLEESQHGTFVGRIGQDLGLEVSELVPRMFRMLSKGEKDYFEVNLQNGILFVNSRIDREELCAKNADCVLHLEVIVEKPLRFFHVEVDIKDINDNAPIFPAMEKILSMAELITASGTRFLLEGATDADIGTNAMLTYKLSPNKYFALDSGNDEGESKSVVLLLKIPLDREESPVHHLVLTATDGGEPKLTGTVQLVINVLDVNDNPPVFNQSAYRIKLLENTASGSLVIILNATDLDEGINREISYSFHDSAPLQVTKLFTINSDTGEIRTIGKLDYEENRFYELPIVAEDKGSSQLTGHCKFLIEVLDMNDNIPELSVNSVSIPLPEDSPPGTVVAIISASDKDSGNNGQINCFLWPTGIPFKLEFTFKNYYSLIVGAPLDREQMDEYMIVVSVEDQGVPPLSSSITLFVPISDINDNAPAFTQPTYTVFVKENNPPGAHIFTVSASDPDVAENALITYWMDEKLWPLSSYISVHSESGKLYALQSLDYEELKMLQFHVRAKDAGIPTLCGNATVQVFVMDENDNAPAVSGSSEENLIFLMVPVMPGHTVGKIHALDADSGYNAWLRYELLEESNGPWIVGQYSGEVSNKYSLDESESNKILVLVKDHGKPPLSATATLSVSLVTSGQTVKTDINLQRSGESFVPLVDSINIYLIIAICSVSSLFLLATLIYVALRCHCKAKEPMVYGPGMATLVCASEVGSWSYSNRHSHILAGVTAEAAAKSDLMIFSPNIPVFANNGELINGVDVPPDSAKKVSPAVGVLVFCSTSYFYASLFGLVLGLIGVFELLGLDTVESSYWNHTDSLDLALHFASINHSTLLACLKGLMLRVTRAIPYKVLRNLKEAINEYGLTSAYCQAILKNLTAIYNLLPMDWKTLVEACLTSTQFVIWKSLFYQKCEEKHAQIGQFPLDQLKGEGVFLTQQQQLTTNLACILLINECALHAFSKIDDPASKSASSFTTIRQGPSEAYDTFIERLQKALKRDINNSDARQEVLILLAYENANVDCQRVLEPLRGDTTKNLADYLQKAARVGSLTYQAELMASAISALQVSSSHPRAGACFNCKRYGHYRSQCRAPGGGAALQTTDSPIVVQQDSDVAVVVPVPLEIDPHKYDDLSIHEEHPWNTLLLTSSVSSSKPMLTLFLNGIPFSGILDTGADVTIIQSSLWPTDWPLQSSPAVRGVGGIQSAQISTTWIEATIPSSKTKARIRPVVLPLHVNLWGCDLLSQFNASLVLD